MVFVSHAAKSVLCDIVNCIMAVRMSFIEHWISSDLRVCEYLWILCIISVGLSALRQNLKQSSSAKGRWNHSHYANVCCGGGITVNTNTNKH